MKQLSSARNFVAIMVMALLLAVATPATSFGKDKHGRSRGRGDRDNSDWSRHNRKCGKFVNCHDARDGRWDGRGPRRPRARNIFWRNRIRNRNDDRFLVNRRFRNRDFDNNRIWRERSVWSRNRN